MVCARVKRRGPAACKKGALLETTPTIASITIMGVVSKSAVAIETEQHGFLLWLHW